MKKVICEICGQEFLARLRVIRKGKGKYCSRGCSNRNRLLSDTTKRKISLSNSKTLKEKWRNPSFREKMSLSRKGIKFTIKHKQKISKSLKLKGSMLGKKHSEEIRKKMSIAHQGLHPSNYFRELAILSNLKQQALKGPTSIEKIVYQDLQKRKIFFKSQHLVNNKFLVDAYIPSKNLIIEADGDYWHNLPKVKIKDISENAYLVKCGYQLLRLSEKEINTGNFINRLGEYLNA